MKPNYISMNHLFGQQIRFIVPLFQRPYVWDRKNQWEPLWEDIATVANRVLRSPINGTVRGHFLGSIVLEHEFTGTGTIERRKVIDGQQRMTTLQLVLRAATHALAALADKKATQSQDHLRTAQKQISSLIRNADYAEGEEIYKVWPTNRDRAAFCQVMDAKARAAFPAPTLIMGAYQYFYDEITTWLLEDGTVGERGAALARGIMHHLHIIVLDLESNDEPQAIFETLNTRGSPLLTVDLVKNWLLREAQHGGKTEAECAALYKRYWQPFDDDSDYWRKRIGAGHANRPRVDTFMLHWLTEQSRTVVTASHVYEAFLDHVGMPARPTPDGAADVEQLMRNIHTTAGFYRRFDEPAATESRFDIFLRRMKEMAIVVFYPLLMHLLARPGSDTLDIDRCAQILESYLIRRAISDLAVRSASTTTMRLLTTLANNPHAPGAPMIREILGTLTGAASVWPDDETFGFNWRSRDLYNGRGARPLLILRALEEQAWHRDKLAMPVASFDWKRVQVEHIMPQSWEKHWPIPDNAEAATRNAAVQRIGNLTLVSEILNPTISNGSWLSKRVALADHAHLRLTSSITNQPNWTEVEIAARTDQLFELALAVWPGPSAPITAFRP